MACNSLYYIYRCAYLGYQFGPSLGMGYSVGSGGAELRHYNPKCNNKCSGKETTDTMREVAWTRNNQTCLIEVNRQEYEHLLDLARSVAFEGDITSVFSTRDDRHYMPEVDCSKAMAVFTELSYLSHHLHQASEVIAGIREALFPEGGGKDRDIGGEGET